VLIFIVAVIMYRVVVTMLMFENKDFRSRASMIASLSAAVVNLLLIMAVGRVYEKLALRLTQWGRWIC
jgi:anoctamin-7